MNQAEMKSLFPSFPSEEKRLAWETKALGILRDYACHLLADSAVLSYCAVQLLNERGGCEDEFVEPGRPWAESAADREIMLYERLYDRLYEDYYLYAKPSAFPGKGAHPRQLIMNSHELLADLSAQAAELQDTLEDMQIPLAHLVGEDIDSAVRSWGKIKPSRVEKTEGKLSRFSEDYEKALKTLESRLKVYCEINEKAKAEPQHAERVKTLLSAYIEGEMTLIEDGLPSSLTEAFLWELELYRVLKTGELRAETLVGEALTAYVHEHLIGLALAVNHGKLCMKSSFRGVLVRLGARKALAWASSYGSL